MSFWNTVVSNNAWEEDDDLDLSDEEEEEEFLEEETDSECPPTNEETTTDQPSRWLGGIRNLVSATTGALAQHDDEEEEEEEEEEGEEEGEEEDTDQELEDSLKPPPSLASRLMQTLAPSAMQEEDDDGLEEHGWEDDDDFDLEEEEEKEGNTMMEEIKSPTPFDRTAEISLGIGVETRETRSMYSPPTTIPSTPEVAAEGWEDSEEFLDVSLDEIRESRSNKELDTAQTQTVTETRDISMGLLRPENVRARTLSAELSFGLDSTVNSGWEDDDLHVDDEDDNETTPKSAGDVKSAIVSGELNFGLDTTVNSGWDDDDLRVEDEEEEEEVWPRQTYAGNSPDSAEDEPSSMDNGETTTDDDDLLDTDDGWGDDGDNFDMEDELDGLDGPDELDGLDSRNRFDSLDPPDGMDGLDPPDELDGLDPPPDYSVGDLQQFSYAGDANDSELDDTNRPVSERRALLVEMERRRILGPPPKPAPIAEEGESASSSDSADREDVPSDEGWGEEDDALGDLDDGNMEQDGTPIMETKKSTHSVTDARGADENAWGNDDGLDGLEDSQSMLDPPPHDAEAAAAPTMRVESPSQKANTNGWDDADGLETLDSEVHVLTPKRQTPAASRARGIVGWEDDLSDKDVDAVELPRSPELGDSPVVVDHVPEESVVPPPPTVMDSVVAVRSDDRSASMAGLSTEDLERDEQDFGRVVDHTPVDEESRTPVAGRTESVLTLANTADADAASLQDHSLATAETPPSVARALAIPSVVVDHVPDETPGKTVLSRKDSTMAVASEQSEGMEDVWREDFDPDDDDYGPVVDHLPVQRPQAFEVIEEVDEEHDHVVEDEKKAMEPSRWVPVSGASVADSLAVVAPMQEGENDETTLGARSGDGMDQDDTDLISQDAHMPEEVDLDLERAVDHVPLRPESRVQTDASTLGFADPSEVSTVGDITLEDANYGPVVDQTPPPRPTVLPSAAGSTMAAAATRGDATVDDLDDVTVEAGAARSYEEYDGASLDTSLPDDGTEQQPPKLVDHVPTTPISKLNRGMSEVAQAEVQSVISTRDDEFGLVVDHTPVQPVQGTEDSLAPLAPLSEVDTLKSDDNLTTAEVREAEVVDRFPPSSDRSLVGSVGAICGARSEDGTFDDRGADDFGDVVDRLPSSSTLPFPPSRGGSTTGALATLSEIDPTSNTNDGWEMDDQLTMPEDEYGDADSSVRTPETKNKSVSWHTQNLEPPPSLTPRTFDETQFFDAVQSTIDATLPLDDKKPAAAAPRECTACSDETVLDCPCVHRLIHRDGEDSSAIVKTKTEDGTMVDIDYKKLLRDEIAKRNLLEREAETYKKIAAKVQSDHSDATEDVLVQRAKVAELEMALAEMRETLSTRDKSIVSLQEEASALRADQVGMKAELTSMESLLEEANEREESLLDKISEATRGGEAAVEETMKEMSQARDRLSSELTTVRVENEQLSAELAQTQHKAECLRVEKESSNLRLTVVEKEREALVAKQKEFQLTEAAAREVLAAFLKAVDSSFVVTAGAQIAEALSSLKNEVTKKLSEHEATAAKLATVEEELQQAESRNFSLMKESTQVAKRHDAEVASLSNELEELSKLQEANLNSSDIEKKELLQKVFALESEVSQLRDESENKSLEIASRDETIADETHIRLQLEESGKGLRHSVAVLEGDKASLQRELQLLSSRLAGSDEKDVMVTKLTNDCHALQLEQEALKSKLQTMESQAERERASLSETISAKEEAINDIEMDLELARDQIKELESQQQSESNGMSTELEAARKILSEKEADFMSLELEMEELKEEVNTVKSERDDLLVTCAGLRTSVEDYQTSGEQGAERESRKDTEHSKEVASLRQQIAARDSDVFARSEEANRLKLEVSSLQSSLQENMQRVNDLVQERDQLNSMVENKRTEAQLRCQDLESQLSEVNASFVDVTSKLRRLETDHHSSRTDLDALTRERDSAYAERDELTEENEELLVHLGMAKEEAEAHEHTIESIRLELDMKDHDLETAQEQLQHTEDKVRQLERNLEQAKDLIEQPTQDNQLDLVRLVDSLTMEKDDLQQQVDDLRASMAVKDEEINSIRKDAGSQMQEMVESRDMADAERLAKEKEQVAHIGVMEERLRELGGVTRNQQEEIQRLSTLLGDKDRMQAKEAASTEAAFQQRIAELERLCAEKDSAIQQMDTALGEMHTQMESLQDAAAGESQAALAVMSRQVQDLTNRLQASDHAANTHAHRIREMETADRAKMLEFNAMREKLSQTEVALLDLELQLNAANTQGTEDEEIESQLEELRLQLQERESCISDMEIERSELEGRLIGLEGELASERKATLLAHEETTTRVASERKEMKTLKEKIAALEVEVEGATHAQRAKESDLRRQLAAFRDSVSVKNTKISSLEQQLQALSEEVSFGKELIANKEEELQKTSIELEDMRAEQMLATQRATTRVLGSPSSRLSAENTDHMRSLIVSLSQALETSESQRAQAIDNLLKERKTNADSLKRLGESVKRFYSTLSSSNSI